MLDVLENNRYCRAYQALVTAAGFFDKIGLSNHLTRKHLRAAVDAARADHKALVNLLLAKGVIREHEYEAWCITELENVVRRYEEEHGRTFY